jgi:hypothetical protein
LPCIFTVCGPFCLVNRQSQWLFSRDLYHKRYNGCTIYGTFFVISVCRYFFEPFASWSWRTELAAAAAAAASSCRVRHGADLCYGITAETQTIGKGILPCQGSLIGNDGPFNGTLHDGESQESGHLLTLTRVVGVAVAWCARTSFKRFRGLARKYLRFCVI